MTIETIDKAAAKMIADQSVKALEAVAEELGVNVRYKGGSYDSSTGVFTPKFEFSLEDSARLAFERDAWRFDLTPEHFGKRFLFRGEVYQIQGINTRAPKFPIKAWNVKTRKNFKFPVAAIKESNLV